MPGLGKALFAARYIAVAHISDHTTFNKRHRAEQPKEV